LCIIPAGFFSVSVPCVPGIPPRSRLAAGTSLTSGEVGEVSWQQFPAVTCAEQVSQEKLGTMTRLFKEQSIFDYLIFMDLKGVDLSVESSD